MSETGAKRKVLERQKLDNGATWLTKLDCGHIARLTFKPPRPGKWCWCPLCDREKIEQQVMSGKLKTKMDPKGYAKYLPRVLPASWEELDHSPDGAAYEGFVGSTHLRVIASVSRYDGDGTWLHVSASGPGRCPDWKEMGEVKEIFVGKDRYAYMVMPDAAHYVNRHPHVLHLWSPLDNNATRLPEFSVVIPEVGRSI